MCLSAKHLDILRNHNERDFASQRASLETHRRFLDLFEACEACPNFDDGVFGDIHSDCRQAILRLFVSMKDDAERYLLRKRLGAQAPQARADARAPWLATACVDASGLFCPMPIQKLSTMLRSAQGGAIVQFISTDPGTPGDLKAFCKATRHALLGTCIQDNRFMAWVQKRLPNP
ncbi:MAG: sulfurtransferase TusA family protein [Myxococcales bacterium]|jgi:TusA-related sulfurtransferase|nr:sulfurtransferase TusA family protein [Myxococcales bacterium]